jgi:hypothetical protein
MINWWNLFTNSIWILALSLALAVVGIAHYQSQQGEEKIRSILNAPRFALPLNLSGAIFCLGMALSSTKWWEVLLWIVLIGLFSYQGYKIKN